MILLNLLAVYRGQYAISFYLQAQIVFTPLAVATNYPHGDLQKNRTGANNKAFTSPVPQAGIVFARKTLTVFPAMFLIHGQTHGYDYLPGRRAEKNLAFFASIKNGFDRSIFQTHAL